MGRFFDDGTSLLDGMIEIEPRRLVLRYRDAAGVGFAVHVVDNAVHESARKRYIDRTDTSVLLYDLPTYVSFRRRLKMRWRGQ